MNTTEFDQVRQRLLERCRQAPPANGDGAELPPLVRPCVPSAGEGPAAVETPVSVPEPTVASVPGRRDIMERLVRRFGWGGKPAARKALYTKLCDLVEAHGERAIEAISEAAAGAAGANRPDRYFAKSVVWKLRERGLVLGGSDGVGRGDFFGREASGGAT